MTAIDVDAIAAALDKALDASSAAGVRYAMTWESPEGFRIKLTLSRDDLDDEDLDDVDDVEAGT